MPPVLAARSFSMNSGVRPLRFGGQIDQMLVIVGDAQLLGQLFAPLPGAAAILRLMVMMRFFIRLPSFLRRSLYAHYSISRRKKQLEAPAKMC
jgi:hypothetical protein